MGTPTIEDGARALSLEPDEVTAAADSPAGLIVTTTDGNQYVVVPEDKPDAAGRTGVMYLVPPIVPYRGDFPVYSQPVVPEAEVVEVELDPVPEGAVRELMAWVGDDIDRATRALEREQAQGKPRANVVAALGKRMAEIADAAAKAAGAQ